MIQQKGFNMKIIVYVVLGSLCAVWAYHLAKEKQKTTPLAWAICGFFFNIYVIVMLYTLHTKEELINILELDPAQLNASDNSNTLSFEGFTITADEEGQIETRDGLLPIANFRDVTVVIDPSCIKNGFIIPTIPPYVDTNMGGIHFRHLKVK